MQNALKIAAIAGVAGAMAFAAPPAEARSGRGAAIGLGVAAGALALGAAVASQQRGYGYYDDGYYARPGRAYYGDSYNSYGGGPIYTAPYTGSPGYYSNRNRSGSSPFRYEGG